MSWICLLFILCLFKQIIYIISLFPISLIMSKKRNLNRNISAETNVLINNNGIKEKISRYVYGYLR